MAGISSLASPEESHKPKLREHTDNFLHFLIDEYNPVIPTSQYLHRRRKSLGMRDGNERFSPAKVLYVFQEDGLAFSPFLCQLIE